jgi:hypothetical protein
MMIVNNEFYQNQNPQVSSKVAVGNPSQKPKGKSDRVDSKASNSHLMRKSRSPEEGHPANYGRGTYISPGQKPKDKTRKSTTRTTKIKRNTASNKHKGSPGFR